MGQRKDETKEDYLARRRTWNMTPENKARVRAYHKRNKGRWKENARRNSYKSSYGVSEAEVLQMAADRGNKCDICGKEPQGKGHCGKLHVDHCHETGKIRGLLCSRCNMGLGLFLDDQLLLLSAANYLENR